MSDFITDRKKQKRLVASLSLAGFVSSLNIYIVSVSLPAIAHYFNTGTTESSRVMIAYFLFFTATLLFFGKLGDKIGFKKLFAGGYFVFITGSFFCAVSPSITAMVIFSCIQGIGAAMLASSAFALISKLLPDEVTGWAFGIYSTVSAIGVAMGAPIGGMLTGFFSWRWIFLINIPVGVAAIFFSVKVIPEDQKPRAISGEKKLGFDILGAALSFLAVFALLYAMNMGNTLGWTSFIIIACFVFSLIFFILFILREAKCKYRLVDLPLFKNLNFTFAILTAFTGFTLMAGNMFMLPFYLKLIKNLKTEHIGVIMMIYSIGYILVTPVVGRFVDKVNPRVLCFIAMLSCAAAAFTFSFSLGRGGISSVIVFLVWIAISYSFFVSPNNKIVMGISQAGQKGMVSGILNTTRYLGMAIGVCLMQTVFSLKIPLNEASRCLCNELDPARLGRFISGFHNAYFCAGCILVIAMIFSLLSGGKKGEKS